MKILFYHLVCEKKIVIMSDIKNLLKTYKFFPVPVSRVGTCKSS